MSSHKSLSSSVFLVLWSTLHIIHHISRKKQASNNLKLTPAVAGGGPAAGEGGSQARAGAGGGVLGIRLCQSRVIDRVGEFEQVRSSRFASWCRFTGCQVSPHVLVLFVISFAQVDSRFEVSASTKVSMSTVGDAPGAQRRQSQDGLADKVVVNSDAISPVRRGAPASTGARISPIDVEALDDEVQIVSASQMPPQRRNQRTRKRPVAVVDLEVDASREGNKRKRVIPVIQILSPESEEEFSLQLLL
ncbi:hypothetical protein GUJ93_ZPchr0002g25352 [Zizania palustris]|uniref:Uncharacterized protein n=1 Tax=Zizania palustris TaxID=103762 RepID=A0A8J5RTI5_ZIZPA|nr:hypothetical protein GUJ93_ZPchr0002g25352 [Zizania palustris]